MLRIFKTAFAFFLFGAMATLMLAFALVNRQYVSFDLSPFHYAGSAPLFVFAFAAFFLGLLIASLMAFFSTTSLKLRVRRQEKRIAQLQQDLTSKTVPILPPPPTTTV